MPSVAILVPVVGRPHNAAPFMESFRASGAEDATVYAVAEYDDWDSQRVWEEAGAVVLVCHQKTFPEKINYGYRNTTQDWIFMVGDDVKFHPGWLEAAWKAPLNPKVIGTRGTPEEDPNGKAEHLLIERKYIDTQGVSWDGPGVVLHEGYAHYYCDNEALSVANRRGVFAFASDSYVEHLHPNKGKGPIDPIYQRGWDNAKDDWQKWLKRRAANMKVAVYGLALNEAVNVEAWAASAKDADYILLADTGSTDDTVKIARELGVHVVELAITPFRFDDAQNAAIAALPREIDWCISLDLDERLQPGWRNALLMAPDDATRVGMWFVWEKKLDQMPEGDHWHKDCHRRTGYRWRNIVHEELVSYGFRTEKEINIKKFQVNHVPDNTKPRAGRYLDMIRMSIREDPKAPRASQWLVWQLEQEGRNEEAAEEVKRYIAEILTFPPAIAEAMSKLSQLDPENELYWLERAEKTAPEFRSHKARLSMWYYQQQEWEKSLQWADAALAIKKPPKGLHDPGFGWTTTLLEFVYMARYALGQIPEALAAAEEALELSPEDERIAGNIKVMKTMLQGADR